mmetsp:Transcript_87346/g.154859  ORF Transcript_87346/g.154859 Transcript_87346/m.154859 type:complete len:901 (+) Transcript_87346:27-2729(+)
MGRLLVGRNPASSSRARGVARRLVWVAGLGLSAAGLAEAAADDRPAVWDYIVVGAGTGGSLCAARLAESGAEVLLIEAGGKEPDWLYNQSLAHSRTERGIAWNYPTRFPQKLTVQNDKINKKRIVAGRVVGGSSAVHGDVYDKPPATEFSIQGLSSWTADRVDNAFARIESDMTMQFLGFDSLDDIPLAHRRIIDVLSEELSLPFYPHSPSRRGTKAGLYSGWTEMRECAPPLQTPCRKVDGCNVRWNCRRSTSFFDFVRQRPESRVTVLTDSQVSRVLFDGGEAIGVELLRNGTRRPLEAFARHAVILSAGALGTPKLLMLSGIGDPLELQRLGIQVRVANREVGNNLADHLAHFTWFLLSTTATIDASNPACKSHEIYNVFFNVTTPNGGDGPLEAETRFYGGCNVERQTYDFGIEAVLLHPKSRGRVVLTSASPEVLPIEEYPPLWEEDYKTLENVIERLGNAVGLQKHEMISSVGFTLLTDIKDNAYLYQHMCCSARAAPSGTPGVLDEDLSVRGVRGLFVADASALPDLPSSHTSAAALLVGEFAAESALLLSARELPPRAAESRRSALLEEPAHFELSADLPGAKVPTVELKTMEKPLRMPIVALGTGTMAIGRVANAVSTFIRQGGMHIDTAGMYDNYLEVREGIESSGIKDQSQIVITTKVMPLGRAHVVAAVRSALEGLKMTGVDIFLLHWPGDNNEGKLLHGAPLPSCARRFEKEGVVSVSWRHCRIESYQALVEEQQAGRIQSIGVSNFAHRHLVDLEQEGLPTPAVLQMEFHPAWHEDKLVEYSLNRGTAVQGYGCLGGAVHGGRLMRADAIAKTAKRLNVSSAQVLHRWVLQKGVAIITGGSSDEHIRNNLELFHFDIIPQDMEWLDGWLPLGLDGKSYGPYPEQIL